MYILSLYANYVRRATLLYKNTTDTTKTDSINIRYRQTITVWFQLSQTDTAGCSCLPVISCLQNNSQSISNGIPLVTQGCHMHDLTVSVRSKIIVFRDSTVTECCPLVNRHRRFGGHLRRLTKGPKSPTACTCV
jgi:hypothetical protein